MNISVSYGTFNFLSISGYPVPKVTIGSNSLRTSSSQYLGTTTTVSLEGIIYCHKMTSQTDTNLPFAKDDSVSALLTRANDFKKNLLKQPEPALLKILAGTNVVVSGSGIIDNINFDTQNNRAIDKIDYSIDITLYNNQTGNYTADTGVIYKVSSVQDSVDIESNFNQTYFYNNVLYPTYNITRTLSAVGNRSNSGSIIEATRWINDRQKLYPFTGIVPTGSFKLYNHSRTIDIDEAQGSINIRDTFLSKPFGDPWIDTYSVSTSVSDDFTKEIKINGAIQGLSPVTGLDNITGLLPISSPSGQNLLNPLYLQSNNTGNMKYNQAVSGYVAITGLMFIRATGYQNNAANLIYDGDARFTNTFPAYKNAQIHPIPISITEGFSPTNGSIDYSYTFNSRPLALIPGALSETFTITDNGPTPRVSSVPVLGRRLGPLVYKYVASSGAGQRTVSYEGVFKSPTGFARFTVDRVSLISIDSYLMNFQPQAPYTGLITENSESINIGENRIRKSITWQYTKCT
jgi:hypothetical protein